MRKIKEVLRLRWACGLSDRQIAHSCSLARSTVAQYLRRFEQAGLSWPCAQELNEERLEQLLFPACAQPACEKPLPDWADLHQELKRKGVTLSLLWQEYKAASPQGYQYSRFCDLYRLWLGRLDPPMRQQHKAGEKLFVDYAGQTVPVTDPATGEVRSAQIFVAVLGASNYTYAEATWSQGLSDWIGSHVRALTFFGGVAEQLIPDNLRSGVRTPCFYEPDINPTYAEMASHYGIAVLPARVRKPKDKAKAEVGVQIVERFILARLRHHSFFALGEINKAIRPLLLALNERPFKKLPGSRRLLFEQMERPALKPLPSTPYHFALWKKARVNIDYHIEVQGHYYSVPYSLVREQLDVRISTSTVECFHRGERVASHPRSELRGRHSTLREHMPPSHQRYLQWTPSRLIRWAATVGSATAQVAETLLTQRVHPEQAFRSCLGIMRLGKAYSPERLEAASQRALAIGACSYKSVLSILKSGMDKKPLPQPTPSRPPIHHENIRGPHYYHAKEEKNADPPYDRETASPQAQRHGQSASGTNPDASVRGHEL